MLSQLTTSSDTLEEDGRRETAHAILLELLAYQFAFPVKWIDTQDTLLSHGVTRFVEFGPSKVLGGLIRQTLESRYGSKELAQAMTSECEISTFDEVIESINYVGSSIEHEAATRSAHNEEHIMLNTREVLSTDSVPITTSARRSKTRPTILEVPDTPLPVRLVLKCLLELKLKNRLSGTSFDKSINKLSKGRSTLQNEILSDIGTEFNDVPDGLEDASLLEVADRLGPSYSGKLGLRTASLIDRLISTKMPSGWNLNTVRGYLNSKWGLMESRQDAVLLMALTSEPLSRLGSSDATKEYFDAIVSDYESQEGIQLNEFRTQGDANSPPLNATDSTQLQELQHEPRRLAVRLHDALECYLDSGSAPHTQIEYAKALNLELQNQLNHWNAEFDEGFAEGIRPKFHINKCRRFRSSWNSVRLEVLKLYHDAEAGRTICQKGSLQQIGQRLANRGDAFLFHMVNSLISKSSIKNSEGSGRGFAAIGSALLQEMASREGSQPLYAFHDAPKAPQTAVSGDGNIEIKHCDRQSGGKQTSYVDLISEKRHIGICKPGTPAVYIRRKNETEWMHDENSTREYYAAIKDATTSGLTFSRKNVLVTGAGPGSIALELVRGLLMGGAIVIVTTSRAPSTSAKLFQRLYEECGSNGSELILVPFNQASTQDCVSLINYIFSQEGLGRTVDIVFPFAAVRDDGTDISALGSQAELAHRLMMLNVMRLLGEIFKQKRSRGIDTRPTTVILPLSSNHGTFGGDGFYAESKLGLESLFERFASESWSDYILICGAEIGWTRGTGLMDSNDMIAEAMEHHGVLTFSTAEMAVNLLALLSDRIERVVTNEPLWVDLNGGLQLLTDLKGKVSRARAEILETSATLRIISEEDRLQATMLGCSPSNTSEPGCMLRRSHLDLKFPQLPTDIDLRTLPQLQDIVELSKVIVVVGFSELGPWGGARTRWEIESGNGLSAEGFIELAWLTGLITHFDGLDKDGNHYAGWVDASTGAQVRDYEVGERYGETIKARAGIRMIEPGVYGGFDAENKECLQEFVVEEDLPPFEVSMAIAESLKLRHGESIRTWSEGDADLVKVQLKRGATIMVPKKGGFGAVVAGQIPTGFDAVRYGVPEDIISQVDPITLYALCCTAEALYSAGITDSYEVYKHIHVAELGLFIGSSLGGLTKTRQMYMDRYLDREVQGDILQETNLNTPSAWINMLLMGGAGPIKTLTGACATSLESLDAACESLLSGKTKMCLVGGVDDIAEEEAFAFSTMKATIDAKEQLMKGRSPEEMSRPTSESRAGFVESHGCGIQIVCTAELALDMGLPIYAIIASSTMAADGISRSIPAPGQGVLSFARESPAASRSSLLKPEYRRAALDAFLRPDNSALAEVFHNSSSASSAYTPLPTSASSPGKQNLGWIQPTTHSSQQDINSVDVIRLASSLYGNNLRALEPEISPLRAGLAVWGLDVDDIDVVSMHGTSTKANDRNESHIIHQQMEHLKRVQGLPIPAICQKSLTGHPKAPAAAWMLNGCIQAMNDSIIPGNEALDSVDEELRNYHHLVFPTEGFRVGEIKAFLLDSFGFGQKGGQVVGVAPKYVFAALNRFDIETYSQKAKTRQRLAKRAYTKAMATNSIVQVKSEPPYGISCGAERYLATTSLG